MNSLMRPLIIASTVFLLVGCGTLATNAVVVDEVVYTPAYPVVYNPGYSNDYVYSVGYYNNRPYWGNNLLLHPVKLG